MNHVLRSCVSIGIVGLFLASTCHAGVDSSQVNPRQTHEVISTNAIQPVTIVSQPTGARTLINGDYVGITPLRVDVAVDKFGRAV